MRRVADKYDKRAIQSQLWYNRITKEIIMRTGTLEDRYNNYVSAMISMGLPYVDFDTWLNR